jgi:hypothetical protein
MTKRLQVRQGDVLVMATTAVCDDLVEEPREVKGVVLAHGEATGHAHAIRARTARLFRQAGKSDRILRVTNRVWLYHDEHREVPISIGDHIVRRQREYRWGRSRVVAD